MTMSDSWNDAAVTTAWDENIPHKEKAMAVDAAAKTEGERESWKWMEKNKPHFDFITIIPCFNVSRRSVQDLVRKTHRTRLERFFILI